MENEKFETWAIVELFGHTRFVGKVSEQTVGGCSFIRLDVPEVGKKKSFTKLYGQNAIYCITPVDEKFARAYLKTTNPEPINVYLPESFLPESFE
jgi:hypothetical protein